MFFCDCRFARLQTTNWQNREKLRDGEFMQYGTQTAAISKRGLWAGRIITGLTVAFLTFDSVIKLLRLPVAVQGTVQLGYPENTVLAIGIVQLVCVIAYVLPRTSILGAILLTGYLGGAVATHVRVGSPLVSHTLFAVFVGVLVWLGLYLRDKELRSLVPVRR
jgi:hypothetical protein